MYLLKCLQENHCFVGKMWYTNWISWLICLAHHPPQPNPLEGFVFILSIHASHSSVAKIIKIHEIKYLSSFSLNSLAANTIFIMLKYLIFSFCVSFYGLFLKFNILKFCAWVGLVAQDNLGQVSTVYYSQRARCVLCYEELNQDH